MTAVPEEAIQAAAEAMCATHISGLHRDMDSPDPRMRIAACFDCQRKAAAAMPAIREALAAEVEADIRVHSHTGFMYAGMARATAIVRGGTP